jgi:MoaA/NifB/PqqE/SkfB family radical SAM enzyme
MLSYSEIRRVHLEISTRCNAACPECPRNFRGVDIIDQYPICDMSLAQVQHIFTVPFVQQLDQRLINGNYGDFITARDGLEIVEYLVESNPKLSIIISTNASGKPNIWTRLGELGVEVQFRIDGLEDTHHLYRQYTDYHLIMSNAKKFIAAGGNATWAMIRFNHNEHQISTARNLAKQMGFKSFELVDAGRDTTVVFTRDKKLSHTIGNYQGSTDFDSLYENYKLYIEHPEATLKKAKPAQEISCYSKKNNEIYISANGEVYPCCWLGFYPLTAKGNPSNTQLKEIIGKNNALAYGLTETIEWFKEVEKSWNKNSIESGRIYTCNETCGKRISN